MSSPDVNSDAKATLPLEQIIAVDNANVRHLFQNFLFFIQQSLKSVYVIQRCNELLIYNFYKAPVSPMYYNYNIRQKTIVSVLQSLFYNFCQIVLNLPQKNPLKQIWLLPHLLKGKNMIKNYL